MENPTAPVPDLATMNRKMRYYHLHKTDPVFQQRMSDAKRRYYQRNKDIIIAKSLARYYANKPPVGDADPENHQP